TLKGTHDIKIILSNNLPGNRKINKVENYTSLPSPMTIYESGLLSWQPIEGAKTYKVYNNGKLVKETPATDYKADKAPAIYAAYQVVAVDKNNVESFASEPLEVIPESLEKRYDATSVAEKANY